MIVKCINCDKILVNFEEKISEVFEIRNSYCYCKGCAKEIDDDKAYQRDQEEFNKEWETNWRTKIVKV